MKVTAQSEAVELFAREATHSFAGSYELASVETLVDQFLREQHSLTAVERFSIHHNRRNRDECEGHYRSLLPAAPPMPGQQYAFEVELDKCSGCKACVTACHSLNGLDETETWRSVGLVISDPAELLRGNSATRTSQTTIQHVTTACHHCADPGCLNGCPVLAYEKDPVSGIVRHLDDQCIGCTYCVMKCPYDVPKYSKRLGIVRKCDMCANRLAVGEAPACVQACPNEAISITLVGGQTESKAIQARPNGNPLRYSDSLGSPSMNYGFLPDPGITQPTTRYITRRSDIAFAHAVDGTELRPAHAHPPLSLMLVLTQLGVGTLAASVLADPHSALLAWLALGTTVAGVIAATLHLGQPLKAWRSFLGWRRSWLSRELLAFGAVQGAMGAHALLLRPETAWAALMTGVAAVFCSAMIYVDTRRAFWSAWLTFPKFALTTVLLGAASASLSGAVSGNTRLMTGATVILMVATLVKLGVEIGFATRVSTPVLRKSALLHTRVFRGWFVVRLTAGIVGGWLLPALLLSGLTPIYLPVSFLALIACVVGEVMERHLFFVCEAAPRMPGGVAL